MSLSDGEKIPVKDGDLPLTGNSVQINPLSAIETT